MAKVARTLYQFPISHYCEKTRWQLDRKQLPYQLKNLLPGLHRGIVHRVAPGAKSVPVLSDGGRAVADSTAIALYLEERYPERPLLPSEPAARAQVLELEEYFDAGIGPDVRRYMYGLSIDTKGAPRAVLLREYPEPLRTVGSWLAPFIKPTFRKLYQLTPEGVESARAGVMATLDRIDQLIGGDPSRYLVGDRLSLADIAGASLLGPLIAPPGSAWDDGFKFPAAISDLREAARARPAGRWVLERYAKDRRPPL